MNSKSIFDKQLLAELNSIKHNFIFDLMKPNLDNYSINKMIDIAQQIAIKNKDDLSKTDYDLYYFLRKELIKNNKAKEWMFYGTKEDNRS